MNCKICESEDIKRFKIGKVELLFCPKCQIFFNREFPSIEIINNYYTSEFSPTADDLQMIEHRRFLLHPEQLWLLKLIKTYKPPPAKLLDFGCDRGYFIDEARRFGYDVTGVELSEKARSYCSKIDLKNYKTINEIDETFDIVTMWHTLEHLPEPLRFLKDLQKRLNNEGFLFIRVPNFGSFWRRLLKSKWIWFQPENHLFHFTKKSLKNLLSIAEYEVLLIKQRKANNLITLLAGLLSLKIHFKEEKFSKKLKEIIKLHYEFVTGAEILAIGRKKL
ncbi:class I SAM-dependent methyltransferase [Bacteroidetes/Chlorobi group bacterium MS-B_bin-24]|nr:MAG: class I SAM-dependent methyltransferase [Bacteroidetes/Chlorobi group bacterium MS-B_bin-24]